jgi:hypothetical protein
VTTSLREITADNEAVVRTLRTTPDQEQFVSTVDYTLREAANEPEGNPWLRAIYADDLPVGLEGSPAGFYARLGFVATGEHNSDGEIVLRLPLQE